MPDTLTSLPPLRLGCGDLLPFRISHRRHGEGPRRVLLIHALTGGPEAADREGVKGWWAPLFVPGAPFDPRRCTVWTPNLLGSCYGSTGPEKGRPFPRITPRDQAAALVAWMEALDLEFDLVTGGSLGAMVALEVAALAPARFRSVGVIGSGGRSDAWIVGWCHAQLSILRSALPDDQALALARQFEMLSFRAPASLDARFPGGADLAAWLDFHGDALAARFTRETLTVLLEAMEAFDLGRDRGGLVAALRGLPPIHVLGIDSDQLFAPALLRELADAARIAGSFGSLAWLKSPHGHDAFLIEWDQVADWLRSLEAPDAP